MLGAQRPLGKGEGLAELAEDGSVVVVMAGSVPVGSTGTLSNLLMIDRRLSIWLWAKFTE